jgi:hypothetical protein
LLYTFRGKSVQIDSFLFFITLTESATTSIAPRIEITFLAHTKGVIVTTFDINNFLIQHLFHQYEFALLPFIPMAEPTIAVETC